MKNFGTIVIKKICFFFWLNCRNFYTLTTQGIIIMCKKKPNRFDWLIEWSAKRTIIIIGLIQMLQMQFIYVCIIYKWGLYIIDVCACLRLLLLLSLAAVRGNSNCLLNYASTNTYAGIHIHVHIHMYILFICVSLRHLCYVSTELFRIRFCTCCLPSTVSGSS